MFMMVVGKMIIIIIKITRGREGAFNNYVDQILPNFDPTPLEWTKIGRITYFLPFVTKQGLSTVPLLLVHVVIE